MTVRRTAKRIMTTMDHELVEWLEDQAQRRDRSVSWMIETAIARWKRRLEVDRERRKRRAVRG